MCAVNINGSQRSKSQRVALAAKDIKWRRKESMKTVTLETAKKLKEAGFPQKTYMLWAVYVNERAILIPSYETSPELAVDGIVHYAAPTAEEVLDQLPECLISKTKDGYIIMCSQKEFERNTWKDESLAEAAAKMRLYLKKEGLL